ncbi:MULTISPECIES: amidohydrolase family protein [Rhodococcus]|uniref:amidohydrolase family protein n=1 Tax=Rhodococcus TaxID=1827 RepID=UPI003517F8FC
MGVLRRNRSPRTPPDGQRTVRSAPQPEHPPRPPRRTAAVQHLANRPPHRGDTARHRQPALVRPLPPQQLLPHHQRKLPHPGATETIQEVGADRLLFAADYPFEDMREAADWFDRLEINNNDHIKIARTNALALLKL